MGRYDDLEHLAKLHQDGVINTQEFENEKSFLLNSFSDQPILEIKKQNMEISQFPEKTNISNKSRLVTLLLCFFLGNFGIHRFYLGLKKTAFFMLILTSLGAFSCGAGVISFITNVYPSSDNSNSTEWEYYGEIGLFNNSVSKKNSFWPFSNKSNNTKNTIQFGIILTFLVLLWKFIDLLLILIGEMKDSRKLRLKRWNT